jgi:phosphohistidine phosphatase
MTPEVPMFIILCRHGEAISKEENPQRPLTQMGRVKVISIAQKAFRHRERPSVIYHSEKLRAKQTGELISQTLGIKNILVEKKGLRPEDDPEKFLKSVDVNQNIVIVGHIPFLKIMASYLLKGLKEEYTVQFDFASMVCFEKEKGEKFWKITWSEM